MTKPKPHHEVICSKFMILLQEDLVLSKFGEIEEVHVIQDITNIMMDSIHYHVTSILEHKQVTDSLPDDT